MHQDIFDLIHFPNVAGVPHQEMPLWILKAGTDDDQSTEIRKREKAVNIFASLTEAESPLVLG